MATLGVPGAYLHAEIPKYKRILMKLREVFIDIICQVKPEYDKNVIYDNGGKSLYLLVLRYICGFIESVLFWLKYLI